MAEPIEFDNKLVTDSHGKLWKVYWLREVQAWGTEPYHLWRTRLGWWLIGNPQFLVSRFIRRALCGKHSPSPWMPMGTLAQLQRGERPMMVQMCEFCGKEMARVGG